MSDRARIPLDIRALPDTGAHLIEASAGTGKTYTITSVVLKMVGERGLPVDRILAVTFTNAATSELRDRIGARLLAAKTAIEQGDLPGEDAILHHLVARIDRAVLLRRLAEACRDVDCASVFTIHGFAARVLRDFPLESGARPDAELIGDQRALIVDIVTDFWLSQITTLEEAEFVALGGTAFFGQLLQVARVAAGSFDVPRVELEYDEGELGRELGSYRGQFSAARAAFSRDGKSLLSLLSESPALNRNKMRLATIEKEYDALSRYFEAGRPEAPPPGFERFTRTKVEDSLKKGKLAPKHALLDLLDELAQAALRLQAAAARNKDYFSARLCDQVQARIVREHERLGTQSFDSLLSDLCLALRRPDAGARLARQLRGRFPVALIDEFQDTDPVQYEIFRRIYLESPVAQPEETVDFALFLIGDPKQSIYAFRGADVFTYLAAGEVTSGDVLTLTTSYRASPALVEAQNRIYSACDRPFGLEAIVYDQITARPGRDNDLLTADGRPAEGIRIVYNPDDQTNFLDVAAAEIAALLASDLRLEGRALRPSDVAVLTRTNREAADMQDLLRKRGIAAVMHGDRSVFEAEEASELRQVLLALCQPKKRGALRAALSTRLFGLSVNEIAQLDEDVAALEQWGTRVFSYAQLWRTRGVARCFEAMFHELSTVERTLAQVGGERRLTNLRHLIEILHDAESTQHLGVFGLIRFLEDAMFDKAAHAMAPEARQLRLESDDHAVVLTTAHKSKGLQYNVVVLPVLGRRDSIRNAAAYRFYDERVGHSLLEYRCSSDRDSTWELHEREELQEGLRLAYVALTRAKHQVITFVDQTSRYAPLRYLLFSRLLGASIGPTEFYQRARELDRLDLRGALDELSAESLGTIVVSTPRTQPPLRSTISPLVHVLVEPPAPPLIVEHESTSSFSSMSRTNHTSVKARQGRDQLDLDVLVESPADPPPAATRTCVLSAFPRGARPGEALHGIFETCSFSSDDVEARKIIVEQQLARYGIAAHHAQAAQQSVEDVLHTPFGTPLFAKPSRLSELSSADRLAEMEFNLPVGSKRARLSSDRLADSLSSSGLSPAYEEAIRRLDFDAFSGFLRGFIDLVFLREGKLYALDYKSNYLGDHYSFYGRDALQIAMEEHHYLLQAIVYSLALHHYGAMRIAGYDYDTHFGGMFYLFLRGMHPDLGENGVYAYRPARALIERLAGVIRPDEAQEGPP